MDQRCHGRQPFRAAQDTRQMKTKRGINTSEMWLTSACIVGALLASTGLLWFDKISPDQWVQVIQWVPTSLGAAYALSRSITKMASEKAATDA